MVELFLPDNVKVVLLGLIALGFLCAWLARVLPSVGWLQVFRGPQMSEKERAARQRTANRIAALEMILAGIVIPMLYGAVTIMMFNDFDGLITTLVLVGSAVCIAAGVWALVRG